MRYPPVAKSVYVKIFVLLLIASFMINRFVYGVTEYGNTLWYDINCIVGLAGLTIIGIISMKQGYKTHALCCLGGALACIILLLLFNFALAGFRI